MSGTDRAKRAEIDNNLERFLELLPELMLKHSNDYVLMKDRSVIGYYKTAIDAQIAGNQQFDDYLFSIQRIKEVAEELGHFAYAIHSREATDHVINLIRKMELNGLKGVFHCFTGTTDQAKAIIDLGFMLGIGGVATFKNSGLDKVLPEI